MKKAVAVLFLDRILKRNGGPSTYLYNLRQGLRALHNNEIRFISIRNSRRCVTTRLMYFLDEKITRKKKCRLLYILFQLVYILNDMEQKFRMHKSVNTACAYQVVHVHHVADAVTLKIVGKYRGSIILTMHTPEPWSDEVVHSLQNKFLTQDKFRVIWVYQHLIEILACRLADSFIFPSREAESVFLKFDFYRRNKGNKDVSYLLTGTPDYANRYERNKVRRELGIPEDKFVLLFAGRHIRIKGYDILVSCWKQLWDNDVYMVCAGKPSELFPSPESPMWKELGWQKNIEKLYDMADAVILPNRETYFDLAAIEALSRGRILIASATGGNNTLARLVDGVILFDVMNTKEMLQKVVQIKEMQRAERIKLERSNRCFYLENCTIESFARNYLKIVHDRL